MTWLSEIETRRLTIENILILRGKLGRGDGEQAVVDMVRMARVIRELARYIFFLEGHCGKVLPIDKMRGGFVLSDDAKEVVDESTAPRST